MVSGRFHRQPPRDAILDPQFLRDRLEVSENHLAGFYHILHRLDYPVTTAEFLSHYHNGESNAEIHNKSVHMTGQQPHKQKETGLPGPAGVCVNNKNNKPTTTLNKRKVQLPKRFLEFLESYSGSILTSRVHSVHQSANTLTTKLVIELHDGMMVESVIMRYDKKSKIPRASLCVSSQVGCAMGCTFCATGTMGKIGNLGVAEILEQIIHANRILREESGSPQVRNVVFMGMGEVRGLVQIFVPQF